MVDPKVVELGVAIFAKTRHSGRIPKKVITKTYFPRKFIKPKIKVSKSNGKTGMSRHASIIFQSCDFKNFRVCGRFEFSQGLTILFPTNLARKYIGKQDKVAPTAATKVPRLAPNRLPDISENTGKGVRIKGRHIDNKKKSTIDKFLSVKHETTELLHTRLQKELDKYMAVIMIRISITITTDICRK